MPTRLRLLSAEDLAYVPDAPEFVSLTSSVLGDAISDRDSFDSDLLSATGAVGDDLIATLSLDQPLAAASFVSGEFSAANHAPLVQDHAALVATSGKQLDGFNTWQGAVSVPSGEGGVGTGTGGGPTGRGGGGGGGGGEGGGEGGPDPCSAYEEIGVHCAFE
jgi:hypothetical protein